MMEKFTRLTATAVPLSQANVDTDQIIPARYLKATDKTGLGECLFSDWRYHADGSPQRDFVLNDPRYQKAQILVTRENFGCGSSREHAAWALLGWGFRAVIAPSFADIFCNNALTNGLLPVALEAAAVESIFEWVLAEPETLLTVDLPAQSVLLPDGSRYSFALDAFSKTCLLEGLDKLGYIRAQEKGIDAYERNHQKGPLTVRKTEQVA